MPFNKVVGGGTANPIQLPVKRYINEQLFISSAHGNSYVDQNALKLSLPNGKYLITDLYMDNTTTALDNCYTRLRVDDNYNLIESTVGWKTIQGFKSSANVGAPRYGIHESWEDYIRPIYFEGSLEVAMYSVGQNFQARIRIRELL